ncbi:L-rhamnose mutarotase [Microbacterium sp. X-17]|uniref:L-rhamnose mutarotase n=1 Tax=Microbacterium sp. X-17 TaxID=3144404 RepID=UPI0031F4AA92
MQRMGHVIGIKPERLSEYRELHRNAWPEVLDGLASVGIRNYTIYVYEPAMLLFSTWEYAGENLAADLERLLLLPRMQEWTDLCAPMQNALPTRSEGEWWQRLPEIFHSA